MALRAGEQAFGTTTNKKGYKVIKGAGEHTQLHYCISFSFLLLNRLVSLLSSFFSLPIAAIQGDGINFNSVKKILDAVLAEGFSAQNVAFGMGGGLLQKVNRDTMSFATKLSFIEYASGECRDVMKVIDCGLRF